MQNTYSPSVRGEYVFCIEKIFDVFTSTKVNICIENNSDVFTSKKVNICIVLYSHTCITIHSFNLDWTTHGIGGGLRYSVLVIFRLPLSLYISVLSFPSNFDSTI